MSEKIYRIQDGEGRGPWRPGFSQRWVDDEGPDQPPPFHVEFTNWRELLKDGYHHGCGCRSIEQMRKWFTKAELWKLRRLGFAIVEMDVDHILTESENQVIFARSKPLTQDFRVYKNKKAKA